MWRCTARARGEPLGARPSLLLRAAAHADALRGAAVHRVQVEDAGLLEGHLAVARLVVYLRAQCRSLFPQGASSWTHMTPQHGPQACLDDIVHTDSMVCLHAR